MKIKEIHLSEFGRFDDEKVVLPEQPFVVVHGPNEAGKSTLRQMILSVLFQFPKKSVLDLYIRQRDVAITKGSLVFELSNGQRLTAERRAADKRFKLAAPDGQELDPSVLTDHFLGIDRQLYETVFCFGLEGMQNFDEVGPAELNDWLFNASMPGAASIIKLEQTLQKKRDDLFKPSGRKPKMNVLLNDLEKTSTALKKWEQKLDRYEQLQDQINKNKGSLGELADGYRRFEEKRAVYQKFTSIQPLIADYMATQSALETIDDRRPFPEQGLERLERLVTEKLTIESHFTETDNRLKEWDTKLEELRKKTDHVSFIQDHVRQLLKRKEQYDRLQYEITGVEEKISRIDKNVQTDLDKLGEDWNHSDILDTSTSVEAEQRLKEMEEEHRRLDDKQRALEQELESKQEAKNAREGNLKELRDALLNESERKIAEAEAKGVQEESTTLFTDHQATKRMNRINQWCMRSGLVLGAITFIVAIIIFMVNSLPAAIAILFIGLLGSAGLISMARMMTKDQFLTREHADNLVIGQQTQKMKAASWRLEQDDRFYLQIEMEEKQVQKDKKSYESVLVSYDQNQLKKETLEKQFQDWKETYRFSTSTPLKWMPGVFQLVSQIKGSLNEKGQLTQQLERLREKSADYESDIHKACDILGIPHSFGELEKHTRYVQDLIVERKQKEEQRARIQEDRDKLFQRLETLEKAKQELFDYAETSDEETFRQRAETVKTIQNHQVKLTSLRVQMQQIVTDVGFIEKCFTWQTDGTWNDITGEDISEEEKRLKNQKEALENENLDLTSELKSMEKDESIRELRYKYEIQQAELNDFSHEWMVCQTALSLLQETKEAYRKEKLPPIIRRAEEYFAKMTDGKYCGIIVGENGMFNVVHESGTAYYMKELSRGTHEQLYLAIRLALADVMSSEEPLPIIIDDGLVNTDRYRYQRIIELLKSVSDHRQVILLTCHPERFKQEEPALMSLVKS